MNKQQQIESGYALVNGARLYYEIGGEGPVVILLHAGIADSRLWNEQFPLLTRQFRVLRYDMRGYGKSHKPNLPFKLRADLDALMRYFDIERAALVGCSLGGATAIDYTLENPNRVTALVTVGSTPHGFEFEEKDPPDWEKIVAAFNAGDLDYVCEFETHLWVDGYSRTPEQVDPAVRRLVYEMNMIALQKEKAAPEAENQVLEPRAAGRLGEIKVPMLAIVGDLDNPVALAGADALSQGIPGARKIVIHGTAHVPSLEKAVEFNRILLDFLRESLPRGVS